jgi:hypothetical protein
LGSILANKSKARWGLLYCLLFLCFCRRVRELFNGCFSIVERFSLRDTRERETKVFVSPVWGKEKNEMLSWKNPWIGSQSRFCFCFFFKF